MTERESLCFEIRYAERVLQLQARLWRRLDIAVKLISLLGGSAAFAALGAENHYATLASGLVLACALAIDLIVRPGDRAGEARQAMKTYRTVEACAPTVDDATLRARFEAASAADEVDAIESLRCIAFNETLVQLDRDPAELIPLSRWQRMVRLLV